MALLLTVATGAWAGTRATGYFDSCTAHHGSIRVKGWAYDPDQSSVSIQVHAYIWYGSSVGTSKDQRMPAVGINTDVERSDVNSAKGITGLHGFDRYITVPAGTYTVEIFAIDKTGDGNPKLPVTGTQSTHITVTVTGDPYNITYDANGGSDAPDAQQKGEKVQLTLRAGVPTREGYTFKEWNTAQDGSGDSYAPGATYTADGDATLYAQWELDLTPSADGTVWTLSTMPEYDVELEVTYYTDAELDQMAADEVIAKITAIGTVTYTPESKALIDAARTAYDALTAAQQALVTNYSTLTDAETTYATAEETAYTEGVELTKNPDGTWSLAATPAFDVELEVEYETDLALSETTDNSAALTEWDGYEADVTLTRTLSAGSWNTFAAPFSTAIPDGWTVKELSSATFADGTLTLNFANAASIEAGKPYLVKVAANTDLSTAPFTGAIVSKDAQPFTSTDVDFIPTLGATTIEGSDTKAVLFLTAGNKLLYPSALPVDMKGFRAYFQLKGETASLARAFSMNFGDGETTGIIAIGTDRAASTDNATYTLDGRRISKATQKGVYIQNGKKVIIK